MDNLALASGSSIQSVDAVVPVGLGLQNNGHRLTFDQLLLAGAHFGHLTQRWNPKMKPFIFSARNGIYLLDLMKTQVQVDKACAAAAKIAAEGEEILFVGTKKQARDIIEQEARRAGCPYVTYRWLGGMLTNFATIRRSLKTLESYEKMAADGTYESLTKKEQLNIEKAKGKLTRVLGGIRDMRRLPGALFIVDTTREEIAVAEARKLGIPIIAMVDTNADPDPIDFPIPANDDAFKSIWLITNAIADAFIEGRRSYEETVAPEWTSKESAEKPRDRSRRRPSRRRRSNRRRTSNGQEESAGAEIQDTSNKESDN